MKKEDIVFFQKGEKMPKGENVYFRKNQYTEDEQRDMIMYAQKALTHFNDSKSKQREFIEKANGNTRDHLNKFVAQSVEDLKDMKEFFQANQDVLDRVDEWEEITGLTTDEIDDMDLADVIELIRGKLDVRESPSFEILDSVRPKNYIIPNNKLANALPHKIPYNEMVNLEVNKQKGTLNPVTINYEDENIEIYDEEKRFTPYDRTVHNAVCSIFEAGNINFTPDQVYRCMNGLDNKASVSAQAVGAITKSLDKSRRIYAKVDYTQEAISYKLAPADTTRLIFEDYILSARKVTLEAGGHQVSGYKLNSKPLLYEYAQKTKQVITVPSHLLDTQGVVNNTKEVIVIREYLIRRIEVMKASNRHSNKITFEKIYTQIGLTDPDKKKAGRIRTIIEKLLTLFASNKYIKKFEFYKSGRSFKGVEIIY